jgi:hypothetical protein
VNLRIILLCLSLLSGQAVADSTTFSSGVRQTVMIELYTSEGCNSCPPAEQYLNSFTSNNQLWEKYIPLAFHVDYWDYLGWQDQYADARHTQRQKQHAASNAARTIYTPGFFVNGKSWRRGFFRSHPSTDTDPVGDLRVKFSQGAVEANFKPVKPENEKLELNIAVLGMKLATQIEAGENEGRYSSHEFVVLGHHTLAGSNNRWQGKLPVLKNIQASSYALVAWLSRPGRPAPIQATGGFIDLKAKSAQKADL